MKNKIFFIVIFSLTVTLAIAQEKHKRYSKHPYWIEMIKDPNVNYFEACKAYDAFWKHKEKPDEEHDLINDAKKVETEKRERKKGKEKNKYEKYALDCKKFEHWKITVFPYVQADGRILSKDEQLEIWKNQRQ